MCKIMVLKGIEDSPRALQFMKSVASEMSFGNTDGIGYAAVNSQNKLFAEKWHNNNHFLDTESVIDEQFLATMEPYKKRLPDLKLNYKAYGDVTRDDLKTVTMHTRYATCGRTFENTHPFVDNDMSLIHNGVISNAYELKLNKISTCDSENALQLYNNLSVNLETEPDSVQSFVDKLKGYWAFAFLAKNGAGQYMLDIVREGATVFWAEVPELGEECLVFATTKQIIEAGLKALDLPARDMWYLPESNYHRFNAVTGEYIDNFLLAESALNISKYHYPNSYHNKGWKSKYNFDTLNDDKKEEEVKSDITPVTTNVDNQLKIIKKVLQGVDDTNIDSFFDTGTLLIDRLYSYDRLMGTNYGLSYEDMSDKFKLMIERKEEENYIIFDDIMAIIEKFQETGLHKDAFKVYNSKKRA